MNFPTLINSLSERLNEFIRQLYLIRGVYAPLVIIKYVHFLRNINAFYAKS